MNNQEAIETIRKNYPKTAKMVNGRYKGGFDDTEGEFGKALTAAIEALEKQAQKEPIKEWDKTKGDKTYYRYVCCKCENVLRPGGTYKYCPYCGQALDWED